MDAIAIRFDVDAHAERLRKDGYTVIEDFLDAAKLAAFKAALSPYLGTHHGRNDFEGFKTERVYTLVARGRLFEESGRNAEALAEFETALAKTPDDPDVQIRVGCSRVVGGQAASAEPLLEKASKARPRSAEAL